MIYKALMVLPILFTLVAGFPAHSDQLMIHGYKYLVGTSETGPRGVNSVASPGMLMAMWDRSLTPRQVFSTHLMLTAEKWTLPEAGYPELLQVGEAHDDGNPYIDYQHPHSSPIMELSVADTIQLGDQGTKLRLGFAPRGPSSDGPISFMHRVTGADYNPDAPLGHHIGQDVGHISSTVATASLELESETLEVSAFNGDEPQPLKVDLPMGPINSMGFRWTHIWAEDWKTMASWASVKGSHHEAALGAVESTQRTSASAYWDHEFDDWHIYNTLIFGELDTRSTDTTQLSFLDEFVFQQQNHAWWGRLEYLQRLPEELDLSPSVGDQEHARWVGAATLGFTQRIWDLRDAELKLGLSATVDVVTKDFEADYGAWPMTGRVFVQLTAMKMWQL